MDHYVMCQKLIYTLMSISFFSIPGNLLYSEGGGATKPLFGWICGIWDRKVEPITSLKFFQEKRGENFKNSLNYSLLSQILPSLIISSSVFYVCDILTEQNSSQVYLQSLLHVNWELPFSLFLRGLACCCFTAPCSALNREPLRRRVT